MLLLAWSRACVTSFSFWFIAFMRRAKNYLTVQKLKEHIGKEAEKTPQTGGAVTPLPILDVAPEI